MKVSTPMTQQAVANADNEMSSAAPAERVFDPMLPRSPIIRPMRDATWSRSLAQAQHRLLRKA